MLKNRAIQQLSITRRVLSTTRVVHQIDPETSHRLNNSSYHPKKDAASPAELRRYERQEGLKGLMTGVFAIAGVLTMFALYQNYDTLYQSIFNRIHPDDEILNKVKDLGRKKRGKNFTELPVLKSDKDSSVPGLYIWGDNSNLIVSADPKIHESRFPIRYDWFDGMRLQLVRVFDKSAVAIDDKGNLIQWGLGFQSAGEEPKITIKDQKLTDAKISNGTLYALNSKGEILLIPESKELQQFTLSRSKWKFWSNGSTNYPKLNTSALAKGETITSFETGQQHLLALTNKGQVYTTTTGYKPLNSKSHGQYGLINHNQFEAPPAVNILQPIPLLNNIIDSKTKTLSARIIKQIACGDNHSIALDSTGSLWAFGENYMGQLGLDIKGYDNEVSSVPKRIDLLKYQVVPRDYFPKVEEIRASGNSTFAKVRPVKMFHVIRNSKLEGALPQEDNNEELETQYIGFGSNLKGQLGSGKFIHSQHVPSTITTLTQFKDYDENSHSMVHIPVRDWSFCTDHAFLTLANNDVLHWGANDHGELGNGKKNRVPKPAVMPALIEPGYTLEKVNERVFVNRLSVKDGMKVVAGVGVGCIYYEK